MSDDRLTPLAFVRARLAQDKRVALDAVGYGPRVYWGDAVAGNHLRDLSVAHYRRYDPDRVLVDIATKEALLTTYESFTKAAEGSTNLPEALVSKGAVAALEVVVRYLTQPYSNHPDYDPAWAPEQRSTT